MSYKNFFITLLQVLCIFLLLDNFNRILSCILDLNELWKAHDRQEIGYMVAWVLQYLLVIAVLILVLRFTDRFVSYFLQRDRWNDIMFDLDKKDVLTLGFVLVCGYSFIRSTAYLIGVVFNSFEVKVNLVLNSGVYYPGKEIQFHIIQWILTTVLFGFRKSIIHLIGKEMN